MKKSLLAVCVLSANLFLTGCADDQARAQLADTNMRLSKLETTVSLLGNKVSNQGVLDLLNQVDQLQAQVNQLNGNFDTVSHNQQTYQDTQNQLNQGFEQRLQLLDGGRGANSSTASAGANASAPVTNSPKSIASGSDVDDSANSAAATQSDADKLKIALKSVKSHDFTSAITQLKSIIKTSQDKDIVANATYYLAVTYAANTQYKDAIITARKFVTDNPQNTNAPDALRTMYISQKQLNWKQSATNTAALLQKNYPDSAASKKVQKDIQQW